MSTVMNDQIRHLQERLAASVKRVADLEAGLRPFAGAIRRNPDAESAALRAFRHGKVVQLDLPLSHFAYAAELVPEDKT